jgi:hypothetical protein
MNHNQINNKPNTTIKHGEKMLEKQTTMNNKSNTNMETESEINAKILKVTSVIQEKFPEISNYIEERPSVSNEHPSNLEKLKAYYESINSLLTKYIKERETILLNRTKYKTRHLEF